MEQDKTCWNSSTSQGSSPSSHSSGGSDLHGKDFSYYAQLEENINAKAKKMTVDYLKKGADRRGSLQPHNQEQIFLVYKFIQTPIDAIIAGM